MGLKYVTADHVTKKMSQVVTVPPLLGQALRG